MKQLIGVCVLFAVSWAGAEVLTVDSILAAHRMGAPADGIVATVNDPVNTVSLTTGDLATLRAAGVPESVIAALQARIPAATPAPAPAQPDDARLVDLVRVLKSGLSESLLAEQLKQSGQAYNLSVNDLLFLKENGVPESIIGTLMATAVPGTGAAPARPGTPVAVAEPVAPAEVVFDGLVLQKATFLKRNRPGKLVLKGETLAWVDGKDPRESFEIQVGGLEKVWATCQARSPENFCYQVNLAIVKGARHKFQDMGRDAGSNAAVLKLMEGLRTRFPQLPFGSPEVDN